MWNALRRKPALTALSSRLSPVVEQSAQALVVKEAGAVGKGSSASAWRSFARWRPSDPPQGPAAGGSRFVRDSRGYEHFQGRGGWNNSFGSAGGGSTWVYGAVGAGALGLYYYYSNRQEIPYSHRKHFVMFSPAFTRAMGENTFQQILAQHRGLVYPERHPKTQFVRRIGEQLAATAARGSGGGYYEHMKNCDWEFKVIKSPQVNAMVAPGGKVIVFSGLLDVLQSEDEVAFVLAHEISHEIARHTAENISRSSLLGMVKAMFYMLFGFSIDGALVLGLELPYSRRAEMEADMIGLSVMAESCFDPRYAPGVHKKIGAHAGAAAEVPAILSTHPTNDKRIRALRDGVPLAMDKYRDQDCETRRLGLLQMMSRSVQQSAALHQDLF